MAQFALSYADQVEQDYIAFCKALNRHFVKDAMKVADNVVFFR